MEETKRKVISWVKIHKKQLLFAGGGITVGIGVIVGFKNKEAIMELWESIEKSLTGVSEGQSLLLSSAQVTPSAVEEVISIQSYTSPQKAYDVGQHIRNLSGGRYHSAEKAAEAAAMGITLLPHQTIVDTYTKCVA